MTALSSLTGWVRWVPLAGVAAAVLVLTACSPH